MSKGWWAVVAVAAATAACAKVEAPAASDAWIRLAAVPGRPAAGYFTLHGGRADTKLVGVSVASVPRVELHLSRMTVGDMMTMDATPAVDLPAGAALPFAPGGRHAMLFDVPPALTPGKTATMTFRFADGQTAAAEAKVVSAGASGPE
ncbi:copper chaperone PCu(A)C [Sphingomonas sp. HHU CXW]|uniref:Copper chaperone PCu(A)C n=1 Tax=Sphingomonas hominis TaxID=2741495 RepID=A0ABX2JC69_9SPHN|nr:copper chaperone PCu(A)C [Sphingomonas hominis]NTS63621.1 copper chaperone PCu(A)C [Sphingomonas hominis]